MEELKQLGGRAVKDLGLEKLEDKEGEEDFIMTPCEY